MFFSPHFANAVVIGFGTGSLKIIKMKNTQLEASKHLRVTEDDLKDGDWVYTPCKVFGSEEEHNIFCYDSRINLSLYFGHELFFYKIKIPPAGRSFILSEIENKQLENWIKDGCKSIKFDFGGGIGTKVSVQSKNNKWIDITDYKAW